MAQNTATIEFHVFISDFNGIENVYCDEQYWDLAEQDALPSNCVVQHVTVVNESDKAAWLAAFDVWHHAANDPRSYFPITRELGPREINIAELDEQKERSQIRQQAREKMKSLELAIH